MAPKNKNTSPRSGVSKKTGEITENGLVIQNLVIRPVIRQNLDIQDWRNYHKAAEAINGTRRALYDLYNDVLLDGFLKRLMAKRVLGVTKHRLKYIDKSGKEVEAADTLINLRQFRKLRQYIQLQKAWGISVMELMNENGTLKVFDVPKKHIRPDIGTITYEQLGFEGFNYRDPPYNRTVLEVGEWDDLGYLLEAACYAIYKRGSVADWANFSQIFGIPFREARYDGFNEQVRLQLENGLEKAGSAAYAILPKDAEFKIHEVKNSANSGTLYNDLRKAMNEEMTVLIIGATETTTSSASSGYAQSETHLKTVDELADDDKEDELAILNEKVLEILINLGLIPKGGHFIYDEPLDLEEANDRVDMALKLVKGGIPISDDFFYEISGIPKPDNYDELKTQMAEDNAAKQAQVQQQQQQQQPTPAKGKQPPPAKADKKMSAEDEAGLFTKIRLAIADFFDPAP